MKRTIYIVDDHRFVREALATLIEDEQGMEVCGMAEAPSLALSEIPKLNPDIVLADLSMPEMSGIELIKRLLILNPLQRTLVLSGYAEPYYADLALTAGANGYLRKDDPPAIIEGIRRLLDSEET